MPLIRTVVRPTLSLEAADKRNLVLDVVEETKLINTDDEDDGFEVRALSLGNLLESIGSAFSRKGLQDGIALHSKTRKVQIIDEFLSHCWNNDPTLKCLCMLLHMNGKLAAFAAWVVALAWLIAEAAGLNLPTLQGKHVLMVGAREISGLAWGYAPSIYIGVTILVFFCGHVIGGGNYQVFLDQACIDQANADRKSHGIRNLGTYLQKSRQLTVLWSADLLSRAWCVFELAKWVSKKDLIGIEFLHLPGGIMMLVSLLMQLIQMSVLSTNDLLSSDFWIVEMGWQLTASVFIIWRTRDILDISSKLDGFRLRDCDCTCCSLDHIDPVTNREMPCDKEFIIKSACEWFGGESGQEHDVESEEEKEKAIRKFELKMSEDLPRVLRQQLGSIHLPFSLTLYLQVYASTFVLQALETFVLNSNRPLRMRAGIAVSYLLCTFFYFLGFIIFHHMVIAFYLIHKRMKATWTRETYYLILIPIFIIVDVSALVVVKRLQAYIVHPIIWGGEINFWDIMRQTQMPPA
eukprot:TRINITY_DN37837_c0_g1_i1.p1 TRINITY_DN37837_c0_g1~~TRINITY_DN37837_c0_g1_i1.p1  ORF type:complete len:519 (-),score=42.71 TRINITY_DN37837_c0_g1_i1:131-1687(-)